MQPSVYLQVRQKMNSEDCLQWTIESGMAAELGGFTGVLRAILAGLLIAGSKSFTHMLLALERYDDLFTGLLKASDGKVRSPALTSTLVERQINCLPDMNTSLQGCQSNRVVAKRKMGS